MASYKQQVRTICCALLLLSIIACIIIGEVEARKNKGQDIILYNGNIVLRGGKGKGSSGSIVVANSPQQDMSPFMDFGMFGRRSATYGQIVIFIGKIKENINFWRPRRFSARK